MEENLPPEEGEVEVPAPMSLEEFLGSLAEKNNVSRQRIDQIMRAADKAKVPMIDLGPFLRTACTNDEELCYMSLHFGIVFGMKAVQPGA
ncbi:MAG: hypothetical protein KAI84_06760 [Gammaproteobacteria bacterium]|nr:hypothetical protein [Gammaproteobacteria bacterium]